MQSILLQLSASAFFPRRMFQLLKVDEARPDGDPGIAVLEQVESVTDIHVTHHFASISSCCYINGL
jgi:hypothetical protein